MSAALRRPSTIVASTSSIAFDYTPRGYISAVREQQPPFAARRYPRRSPSRRRTTIAMSSRGAPAARSSAARSTARTISAGGPPPAAPPPPASANHPGRRPARRRARRRDELVDLERPARGARVEHAVGVEQQRVARLERDLARAHLDAPQQRERAA